ncbi:DUF3693 domain-containing protein [Xanthomonas euvesicatoria]|uniref:DUF3693 domain-containing protein n=1 Tax=Xanthomonas euvesicatoria TaxID=456327 RepID=UPI003D2F8FBF
MAGDDPSEWLVAVRAIRSDGKAGKAWAALAKRLAATALVFLCAIGVFANPLISKENEGVATGSSAHSLYIM